MATHVSSRKRARQEEKRRVRNRRIRSGVRSLVKDVRSVIEAGGAESAAMVRQAESAIRRAASKGVLTKKQASRRVSRLALASRKARSEA